MLAHCHESVVRVDHAAAASRRRANPSLEQRAEADSPGARERDTGSTDVIFCKQPVQRRRCVPAISFGQAPQQREVDA